MKKKETVKCWEAFECNELECPVFQSKELMCWLVSGTHCRNEIQGKFLEKMEMCFDCRPFKENVSRDSMEATLKVVSEQFIQFRQLVDDRDRELESISMEMAVGLSEVFDALKKISSGNPLVRISDTSELELISKLKHMVNVTSTNLAEIVDLSHEFAIGLAEHFDVLHRVSRGDLTARVHGSSQLELLELLKDITNQTIKNVSQEIAYRQRADVALRKSMSKLQRSYEQSIIYARELRKEVSERRQAEIALRESREQHRRVLEASPDPVVVYDMEGNGTYISSAFTEVFGWTPEEVLGRRIDYVPEKNQPETKMIIRKLLAGESFSGVESRRYTKDGRILDVSISAAIYENREGVPVGSVHILRDITDHKRAVEALREARSELERRVDERTAELTKANEKLGLSEEKYRLLFNNDPNPLFLVDMDSQRIIDANNPATVTYHYERDELLGMSFLELFDDDEATRLWEDLKGSHQDVYVFIPRISAKKQDGRHFFIHLHASAVKFEKWESEDIVRALIIRTVDITRRLERDAMLDQASKMATLGEMATGVAHELNQPLNVIQLGTDFLRKMIERGEGISDEELSKVSRNISEQVMRASKIVDHLREFGRRHDMEVYPLDLNEPIQDVFKLLGQQLKLRDIEVVLQLDQDLPKMLGDKNRLEQIFLNLVANARDAMVAKGPKTIKKLTITTCHEGDSVLATVSDTGTGIPDKIQKKIFDPFFTTKEPGKGTGLGLSIAYNLAKDFKGEMDVTSTLDVGTTFRIRFPIWEQKHGDREEAAHH